MLSPQRQYCHVQIYVYMNLYCFYGLTLTCEPTVDNDMGAQLIS